MRGERQGRGLFHAILAIILIVVGAPAVAGADSLWARQTRGVWFMGIGGALGLSNFDDYDGGDPTGGPTFRVGIRPVRAFAVEAQADYFVKFEDGNARPILATANGRWMIPRGWLIPRSIDEEGRWQPFLLGGAGWMQGRQTEDGEFDKLDSAVFRVGLGVEYYPTLDFAWRIDAQYMIPAGDASDLQFAALLITLQLY